MAEDEPAGTAEAWAAAERSYRRLTYAPLLSYLAGTPGWIIARRSSDCSGCGARIAAGAPIRPYAPTHAELVIGQRLRAPGGRWLGPCCWDRPVPGIVGNRQLPAGPVPDVVGLVSP